MILFQLPEKVRDDGAAVLIGDMLDDVARFHHLGPMIREAARTFACFHKGLPGGRATCART